MEKLLSSLNPEQLAAVKYTDGPELVIAGAGSGKTRVLTYKIAYLISCGVKPWNILALTFTNKAAKEMIQRVGEIVGSDVSHYLHIGTFHSVFLRILRQEAEYVGLKSNFTIYDDTDSRALVNSIVDELGLDDRIYKAASVLSRIGMAKNNLISPDVYLSDGSLIERDNRSNMPKIGEIYRLYSQRMSMANAIDFDDMLMLTYKLFVNNSDIKRKYIDRFKYVLVDEYQDTNYAQQSVVTLLTMEKGNICVVGDDAQSIYAFRGANIDNILNFQNIYTGTKLFKLERNYRSTKNIVDVANSLISHNVRQIHKNVFSENTEGEKVHLDIAYSDKEEAKIVANHILRLHRTKNVSFSEMSILYRTNAQSRIFEDEFRRQGIPYKIYGGMSFYQRKEIKDIIAYFRLVSNPNDDEALKRIINYPRRGIGNTTIGKLITAARENNVSLWTVVSEPMVYANMLSTTIQKKVYSFSCIIKTFIDEIKTSDVFTLGKRIVEECGLTNELKNDEPDQAKEKIDNVEELFSGIRDFVDTKCKEGLQNEIYISNFLQEISLQTDADKADSDAENSLVDRVVLMTVHASKGLEFNTVFVVGMEENLFPSQRSLGSPRELEEERRLFYVALTRAEERCYISCAKSRYQYGSIKFNQISRFLKDIDANLLKVCGGKINNSMFGDTDGYPVINNPLRSSHKIDIINDDKREMSAMHNPSRFKRILSEKQTDSSYNGTHATNSHHSILAGTTIEHSKFGIGKVVSVEGEGENEKAKVDFTNSGVKTLLLKFARIKIINS